IHPFQSVGDRDQPGARPSPSRRACRRSSSELMSSRIAKAGIVGPPSPDHNICYSRSPVDATSLASQRQLSSVLDETPRLAGRFDLLHLPLSAARWLVRILPSVVQPLVLTMLNARHNLSLRRTIAGKLVGDHNAGRPHLLLQQLAK